MIATLERVELKAPVCAVCRVPQAKWIPDALEHLCARCEADPVVRTMIARPKKPNAVC